MGRAWFPLALFGFTLLVVAGLTLSSARGWFAYTPDTAAPILLNGHPLPETTLTGTGYAFLSTEDYRPTITPGANTLWLITDIAVYLGTLGWYADRAWRRGSPLSPVKLGASGLGGPAVILLLDFLLALQKLDAGLRGALIATAGLLVLAWLERSVVVLAVAVLYALVGAVFLTGVTGALAGAVVVFAGAFAVLLRRTA